MKMKLNRIANRIALAVAVCVNIPSVQMVYAQEQEMGSLEEIIVTARKRTESLQDAPLTVQALSSERINKFDVTSIERLQSVTPQLYVGRSPTGPGAQITMRGIGASSSTSIGIEQSVAVIMNGAYYGQGRVLNEGMFDLRQIEILKGPQSLFFGKNATAGVISVSTARPTDELEIVGKVGYEIENDQMQYEGILSGPISDTVGARLAVRYRDMDEGYIQNRARPQTFLLFDFPDAAVGNFTNPIVDTIPASFRDGPQEQEKLARLTITADPTEDLSMAFTAQYSEVEIVDASFNQVFISCDGGVSVSGNPCGDTFATSNQPIPQMLRDELPFARDDQYNDYEGFSLNAEIDYSFDNYTLSSVTNYQENENAWSLDGDFQDVPSADGGAIYATEFTTWEAFSQELRLSSEFDGPFNYMLGVLYQKTDRQLGQWVSFGGALGQNSLAADPSNEFLTYFKDSYTDGETISPFFEVSYELSDTVEVTAGARYTDETKESEFAQPYVHPFGIFVLNWREGSVPADQSFDELSPEATITWNVTDEINLYAAYKTAYKSGGFSNGSILSAASLPTDFTFEPETAEGFEIGMKSTLLNNQLRLNASIYSYEYDNLQLDYFNSATISFITVNAGKATSEGAELELEFAPIDIEGLVLRGTLSYNDAVYDSFIAPCWDGQTAALGCNATIPGTRGAPGQDISGQNTGMAPEWSASFGFTYDGELSNGWNYGIAADALYSDDYNASAFGHPLTMRDGYTMLNASAYIAGEEDKWQLQILGKNLTEEMVVSGVTEAANSGAAIGRSQADIFGYVGPSRTIALELTVRY